MDERQRRVWLGSGLVVLQFGLLAMLALLAWPAVKHWTIPLAAWPTAIGAVLLAVWALGSNRLGNFNIRPIPKTGGVLVTQGPYHWIRHPMYTAFLLGAWALARTAARDEAWLAWYVLTLVLWLKSRYEERWMLAQHPGYAAYRQQTKRFLPWLF
ncbi:MAG: S-isoprenylcysteine methyltransferase [Curvibacter sp. GWA2_64_110]|nr:MAG: S-isoprenylcysteine methyltransferase [Curvibacter sp. GWA2_64_110]HCY15385.1 isoprenylcysteine carboxylmethyltransferase family protein [Curvibacter sp.]